MSSPCIWIFAGDLEKEAAGPLPALRAIAAQAQKERRQTIVIFGTIGGKSSAPCENSDGAVIWLAARRYGPFNWHFAPKLIVYSVRQWFARKPNAVLMDGLWYSISPILCLVLACVGAPVYLMPHGSLNQVATRKNEKRKRLALVLMTPLLKKLRGVFSLSPLESQEISAALPGASIYPTSNPINVAAHEADAGDYILYLGRIDPIKNLEFLINAYADLIAINTNAPFLRIVGPGRKEYIAELIGLCAARGVLEKVHFVGPKYGEDKVREYRRARCFVMASHSEAQPYALLEALSFGVPSVVSAACRLWFEDRAVLVCPNGDRKSYVASLNSILQLSPLAAGELRRSAREFIQLHYIPEIVWARRRAIMIRSQ